jgi:hypothetical protein
VPRGLGSVPRGCRCRTGHKAVRPNSAGGARSAAARCSPAAGGGRSPAFGRYDVELVMGGALHRQRLRAGTLRNPKWHVDRQLHLSQRSGRLCLCQPRASAWRSSAYGTPSSGSCRPCIMPHRGRREYLFSSERKVAIHAGRAAPAPFLGQSVCPLQRAHSDPEGWLNSQLTG